MVVLNEVLARPMWAKAAAVVIQLKINSTRQRVRAARTVDERLGLISDMINLTAGLTTIAIATNLRLKSKL